MRSRETRGCSRAGLRLAAAVVAIAAALASPVLSGAVTPLGKNGRIAHQLDGDIAVMAADGSGQDNLTPSLVDNQSLPAFSPTGSALLFWEGNTDDIWVMRPDGSGQDNLTESAPPAVEFAPVFFPDGRHIAFSLDDGSQIDIWVSSPTASGASAITETPADDEYVGDISADGRRILFTKQIGGMNPDSDVWVMNADGSGVRNLTETAAPVGEFFASFSPSGSKIVYDRCVGGECDVYTASASGANQRPLADAAGVSERHPVFSPNGKLIAFVRSAGGQRDIWTMKLDGSNQEALLETLTTNESTPDWESVHRCAGKLATIVGDDGPDRIRGTKVADVILGFGGKDKLIGRGGNDRLCGGKGRDRIRAGKGRDRCKGGPGRDLGAACERGKL